MCVDALAKIGVTRGLGTRVIEHCPKEVLNSYVVDMRGTSYIRKE